MSQSIRTLASFEHFDDSTLGWFPWSPRPEISPLFDLEPCAGHEGHGALRIRTHGNPAAIGSWRRRIDGVTPGRFYRLVAHYRPQSLPHEKQCVYARLNWLDARGQHPRQPDNAIATEKDGDCSVIDYLTRAPEGATSVVIELELRWALGGSVCWDRISLAELDTPPRRPARIATVYHRPRNSPSAAESVSRFCQLIESASPQADLICLPEGITVVGTPLSYHQVSESIPGPTTQTLGQLARKLKTHIIAGIYERVGPAFYNTSILIDRTGHVVGAYRKTHLPQEEVEAGITPGDCFPVFSTDFARIGMMICWDLQFPEPARQLALKGAEIIALPIWGGNETLARARAIENHAYLVSSSYDMKSFIIDPTGQVLAEATLNNPVAIAEIDLAQLFYQPWLGDMRHRTWKEYRPDLALRRW